MLLAALLRRRDIDRSLLLSLWAVRAPCCISHLAAGCPPLPIPHIPLRSIMVVSRRLCIVQWSRCLDNGAGRRKQRIYHSMIEASRHASIDPGLLMPAAAAASPTAQGICWGVLRSCKKLTPIMPCTTFAQHRWFSRHQVVRGGPHRTGATKRNRRASKHKVRGALRDSASFSFAWCLCACTIVCPNSGSIDSIESSTREAFPIDFILTEAKPRISIQSSSAGRAAEEAWLTRPPS